MSLSSTSIPTSLQVLQCLTMASCTDVANLERVETIGDSFLKYVTSVALSLSHPDASSGELSVRRCRFISNENLFKLGVEKNFPGCIYYQTFDPTSNWLPPSYVYQPSDDAAEATGSQVKVNFSEDWKAVETGVWSSELVNTEEGAAANPEDVNAATYRIWAQTAAEQQTGVDWGTLEPSESSSPNGTNNLIPLNGTGANGMNGTNGINGRNGSFSPRNGSLPSSPFGVFSLSDDLLGGLEQSEIDQEIEDLFLDPEGEILSPPDFSSSRGPTGYSTKPKVRSKNTNAIDKSNLPSPYLENCLSDKSIADVIEALIGCYFVQSGSATAFKLMSWLNLPVIEKEASFQRFMSKSAWKRLRILYK